MSRDTIAPRLRLLLKAVTVRLGSECLCRHGRETARCYNLSSLCSSVCMSVRMQGKQQKHQL